MNSTTNERNLEACVLALARQSGTMPPELHSQIQAAGRQLAKDESAVSTLREIIGQDSDLSIAYDSARIELQSKYEDARERSKNGGVAAFPNGSGRNGITRNGNLILELAVPILTADNFSSAAQRLVAQPTWQAQIKNASADVQTFFRTLKETVTRLDPIAIEMLALLDQDTRTVESITYRLDLPEEKGSQLLHDLWQRHYIYRVAGNVTSNLWFSMNPFARQSGTLSASNHLALTPKGYFYLHPHPLFSAIAQSK